jgi:hypothetical protein
MRPSRQMLRLHRDDVSARGIGRTLGVARSTIQDKLERARKAGIRWPLSIEWGDEVLEQRLVGTPPKAPSNLFRPQEHSANGPGVAQRRDDSLKRGR